MSNMSYCRFQNTLAALHDCRDAMQEIMDIDSSGLSEEEDEAMKLLIKLCATIAGEWEGAL